MFKIEYISDVEDVNKIRIGTKVNKPLPYNPK